MLEEEGVVIAGLLVGLNVLDCNMCIKGDNLDEPVCATHCGFITATYEFFKHSCFKSSYYAINTCPKFQIAKTVTVCLGMGTC